jgi:7-carboxy-7-deazaguanine synthase
MLQINDQEPAGPDRTSDGSLLVHSIFPTIQGEGPYAGQFAIFIRLADCNLQCPGCDTDYTSNREPMEPDYALSVVMGQLNPGGLVVITGGEPFRQNITPLTEALLEAKFRVQVETNGTLFLSDFPFKHFNGYRNILDHPKLPNGYGATVVVSPKTRKIHPMLAASASAFKYVLQAGYVADDGLPTVALGNFVGIGSNLARKSASRFEHVARPPEGWEGPIYLQPMDEKDERKNVANVLECVHSVMRSQRYILGFQMHKYVNLP